MLTVAENGYGKRTELDEYRLQSRGGVGIINIQTSERNGKVVGIAYVHDDDELMLITSRARSCGWRPATSGPSAAPRRACG